jgi:hypothetical protein
MQLRTNATIKLALNSSTFMQVPLDRMTETMQRIVRLGGKIVSIHPLNGSDA